MSEKEQITVFAKTNFRNQEVPFGIKTDDRRRHMYVIGKTGMGKTTLMENMVIQDIHNGHGVAFLDPHGDSVQKILNCIPNSRINDVIYFNPADMEFPIAFNILEAVDLKYKHLVASGLMGVFTKIWANLWSARMEYILNNTILALLDSPGNTMLGITRMYVDKKYRKKIVDNIKDPMVRAFWVDEFANYNEKYRTEAIAPIQNKVGQFLSNSIIRNIVGQPKSTIDLREIMDQRKILIMDLSKGKVGEDNSALLGAMLVTKLQLAAMSRTDIPEAERSDFYLYVDEFQNFATESFATILSEARKYRLALIVGHQYIAQLEQDKNTKVRDAIFGNVGTLITFRVGAADAEFMETEFDPTFTPNDLVNLPKYNIILKLMINGVASEPFSAVTLAPNPSFFTGNADKVIKVSRERYSNPIKDVEDKISRWMGAEFHQESAVVLGEQDRDVDAEASPELAAPAVVVSSYAPAAPVFAAQKSPASILQEEDEKKSAPLVQPKIQTAEKPAELHIAEKVQNEPTISIPEPRVPLADLEKTIEHMQQEMQSSRVQVLQPAAKIQEKRENLDFRQQKPHSHFARPRPHNDRNGHSNNHHGLKKDHKKENPIWNTVASLHQEKVKQGEKRVGEVVKQMVGASLGSTHQEQKKEEPEKSADSNSQQERKILQPGQSQKF